MHSDTTATSPGRRYHKIIKILSAIKPAKPAHTPERRASLPSVAPMVCVDSREIGSGKAPRLRLRTMSRAVAAVKLLLILALSGVLLSIAFIITRSFEQLAEANRLKT